MTEPDGKFIARESSWLQFNRRVLAEAMDPSLPLLERLKFIGIVSSNLDEFFMVRVASLLEYPEEMRAASREAFELIESQTRYFSEGLVPEMQKAGIERVFPQGLTDRERQHVTFFFRHELFPVLTPIAIYPDKPVPVLSNLNLYLGVSLKEASAGKDDLLHAVIEVPRIFPRMIVLPKETSYRFLLIEDVIKMFVEEFFPGFEAVETGLLRITRAAEMTIDEEKDEDFAEVMTEVLRRRQQNSIVRLEISASDAQVSYWSERLGMDIFSVWNNPSWMDLKSISQLAFQPVFFDLKRPSWVPKPLPQFDKAQDIWTAIREKDVLVHHPYDSFDAVSRFVHTAAEDPDVLAIKQTLYRAGPQSSVISALEKAGENGKNVTALIELKARFDEDSNIHWARRLEMAGVNVLYGVSGFKTHAKACRVIRREADGIRKYVHLSTGNYNEKTAALYSDIGLFTCQEEIAQDLSSFFNMVTGYSQPAAWRKIEVAPFGLRRRIIRLIGREVMRSTREKPGLIRAKMNSLADPEVIEALYRASQKGVRIELNVRGICGLRPGMTGVSENISVISVVDMFLEHSRIFYFQNGGDEEVYLSSSDWMPRNFDRRIEIMFPVEAQATKKEVIDILGRYFLDNTKAWRLLEGGGYEKLSPKDPAEAFRAQEYFCKKAQDREKQMQKAAIKELKPQKPGASRTE